MQIYISYKDTVSPRGSKINIPSVTAIMECQACLLGLSESNAKGGDLCFTPQFKKRKIVKLKGNH